jgi:hypothetical protein
MSGGAIKGLEVLLIAGGVFWFAYAQMKALKQPTADAEKRDAGGDGAAEAPPTAGETTRNQG